RTSIRDRPARLSRNARRAPRSGPLPAVRAVARRGYAAALLRPRPERARRRTRRAARASRRGLWHHAPRAAPTRGAAHDLDFAAGREVTRAWRRARAAFPRRRGDSPGGGTSVPARRRIEPARAQPTRGGRTASRAGPDSAAHVAPAPGPAPRVL